MAPPPPKVTPLDAVLRPRVLLADDGSAARELCLRVLQEEGYRFEVSDEPSPRELPAALDAFDLVIVPASDGPSDQALVDQLKALPGEPALVFLTAEAADGSRAGWPCVPRPLDPLRLSRAIAWALHKRSLARGRFSPEMIEALYRAAMVANQEQRLERFLEELLHISLDILGAETGSVMIVGPGPHRPLTIVASRGLAGLAGPVGAVGERVAGWVAQTRRALRLAGPLAAYPQFADLDSRPGVAESLVAPMVHGPDVLGVVNVASSRAGRLPQEKLALLMSLAEIGAAVLHRDRLARVREHQDRLAMLGQLSAGVAHELSNPLTCVRAGAEHAVHLLTKASKAGLEPALTQELLEVLGDIGDGAERMVAIAGSVRMAARQASPARQPVDLNALLRRAATLVEGQFRHRVTLAVEPGAPPPVAGDPARLTQILVNLLVNAGQAIQGPGHIWLRSRAEDGQAVVDVEDDGPGIPPGVAEQLFQPFFTTKPEGEGTGLGLTLCRQIARDHGGEVTFDNVPGRGACFRLRLPALEEEKAAGARPVALVVDDEPETLKALVRLLSPHFEVRTAASVSEALPIALREPVQLVLTDYTMPQGTGLDLVKELRALGCTASVMIVTGASSLAEIEKAMKRGVVSAVIEKPWVPRTLVAEALRWAASAA